MAKSFLGESLSDLKKSLERILVGPTPHAKAATHLIEGETGTGKSTFAMAAR